MECFQGSKYRMIVGKDRKVKMWNVLKGSKYRMFYQ